MNPTPRVIPGVLVLEDPAHPEGLVFSGELFGHMPSSAALLTHPDRGYGEACFNTSLTGYQEVLTDPSYYGQIVCMTNPHIGNTGVNDQDPESHRPWVSGFVVFETCEEPSNWRSQGTLDAYLKEHKIPGIKNVDTRKLTRHLRTSGAQRALILPTTEVAQARELFKKLPQFEGRDLIREVSTRETYRFKSEQSAQGDPKDQIPGATSPKLPSPPRVVAIDFGAKRNILRQLSRIGCEVIVMPATSTSAEVLAQKPDGIFLSNGPGDPAAAPYAAQMVREILGKKPIFGICMGHQILSIALGAKTFKLKFGHRGANQPIFEKSSQRVRITSQNHGYAVDPQTLPSHVTISHTHLNDRTVAGIDAPSVRAFSVQYHPEACPGPHDSVELFDRFLNQMTGQTTA